MYSDVFCKVYNEFGWNCYPEAFGQHLLQWLAEQHLTVKSCLDLPAGCGRLPYSGSGLRYGHPLRNPPQSGHGSLGYGFF